MTIDRFTTKAAFSEQLGEAAENVIQTSTGPIGLLLRISEHFGREPKSDAKKRLQDLSHQIGFAEAITADISQTSRELAEIAQGIDELSDERRELSLRIARLRGRLETAQECMEIMQGGREKTVA